MRIPYPLSTYSAPIVFRLCELGSNYASVFQISDGLLSYAVYIS